MNNLISPNDFGTLQLTDYTRKLSVEDLVRQAKKEFKKQLLEANAEILGVQIKLTTSKTRFGGERFWFVCPICNKKVGLIYKHSSLNLIGCRICLNLKYANQRYKGMVEGSAHIL